METILFLNASQFVLILTRILVMLLIAPIFAGKMIPVRFRVGFAFLLAVLLALHENPAVHCFQNSLSFLDAGFLSAWFGEIFLGLVMGTSALLLFEALRTAGTVIAYVGGVSFPVDGGLSNEAAPIVASLFYALGTAAIFLAGGHLLMMETLLDSFAQYPAGTASYFPEMVQNIPQLFYLGFQLGIHIALPILTMVLLVQIGMAILSRVLPQLDIFSLSFPINVLVAFFILSITIGAGILLFQNGFVNLWQEFFPAFS